MAISPFIDSEIEFKKHLEKIWKDLKKFILKNSCNFFLNKVFFNEGKQGFLQDL